MRKQAMLFAVKDSLISMTLFTITYFVFTTYANQDDPSWFEFFVLLAFFGAAVFTIQMLVGLGASTLLGGSYHANKSEYGFSFAVFNEDRKSSILHTLRAIFFYILGAFLYPIAVLVTLINIKQLFSYNEDYEEATDRQMARQQLKDEMNSRSKTSDKKWKVSAGLMDDHYFHSEKEAYDFIYRRGLDTKPSKLF